MHGLSKYCKRSTLDAGIPNIAGILRILRIPFRIPGAQWKICEKFDSLFCFPKQTIRSNCLHKAFGIAFMWAAGVVLWKHSLSKIYQKPRLYTAAKSDKNSLNPLRSVSSVCIVVACRSKGRNTQSFRGLKWAGKCSFSKKIPDSDPYTWATSKQLY